MGRSVPKTVGPGVRPVAALGLLGGCGWRSCWEGPRPALGVRQGTLKPVMSSWMLDAHVSPAAKLAFRLD